MTLYRHELATCPWCNGASGHRVDHLYAHPLPCRFGPWRCAECDKSFEGTVRAPGDVELIKDETASATARAMSLLKFDGKDGPTFFVMDHRHYSAQDSDEEKQGHDRYFFEEHSCPTNWLRHCAAVIQDGDTDPHGFLTFVRSVEVSEDFDADQDNQWAILFPEAFGGETIDATATEVRALAHPDAVRPEKITPQ